MVGKLATFLIKTRILKISGEQIKNKSKTVIDNTFEKFESLYIILKIKENWRPKQNQDNPMRIAIIGNLHSYVMVHNFKFSTWETHTFNGNT